jgi:hypothetical protein
MTTGTEDKMETSITVDLKSGKYRRPASAVINDVADILNNFMMNNKLEDKRIEYRGMSVTEKRSKLEVRYGFTTRDNKFLKGGRMKKEEVVDGSEKVGKGNKTA